MKARYYCPAAPFPLLVVAAPRRMERSSRVVVALRTSGTSTFFPCRPLAEPLSGPAIFADHAAASPVDNTELRIFTTTLPTDNRLLTLMHDPQYRLAVAWQNVAHNQPPHPGFFLGAGMAPASAPEVETPGAPQQ